MMLENLRKNLESERKNNDIFDVVLYGSCVKGASRPKDLDMVVIFVKGTLKERVDKIQQIKNTLKKTTALALDIKQMMVSEFFEKSLFSRTGIINEGISLLTGERIAEKMGYTPLTLFSYNLNTLNHNKKIQFGYILRGRNQKGMLEKLKAEKLGRGVVKVPIENSLEFEELLKKQNIQYLKKTILEEK